MLLHTSAGADSVIIMERCRVACGRRQTMWRATGWRLAWQRQGQSATLTAVTGAQSHATAKQDVCSAAVMALNVSIWDFSQCCDRRNPEQLL